VEFRRAYLSKLVGLRDCNFASCSAVTIQESTHKPPESFRQLEVHSLHMSGLFRNRRGIDTIIASLLMVVIVVIASVMVFTYATGLFGALLVPPRTATENISLEYASFQNNTDVTLFIRNTGSTPITLKSYYVSDGSGSQYARTNWLTGPLVAPGPFAPRAQPSPAPVILISSTCGTSCTTTGTAFTFKAGNPYTITLVTSINSQFSLTIIR
jgi:hypothetical protein